LDQTFLDEFEIRRLIENWVIWRDSGDFERFATLWHANGQMIVTWNQSSAVEFTQRAKAFFDGGSKSIHMLGGSSIEVAGSRAVAQTKVAIKVRGDAHGTEVDVTSFGRFVDFLLKEDGRWQLCLRTVIYEMDQMVPVVPGAPVTLDAALLGQYPEGYRYLAYLLKQVGAEVKKDLPGTRGPEVAALMADTRAWLAGESLPHIPL
jgi:hypothetical protein